MFLEDLRVEFVRDEEDADSFLIEGSLEVGWLADVDPASVVDVIGNCYQDGAKLSNQDTYR